jgi:hypothetical protein
MLPVVPEETPPASASTSSSVFYRIGGASAGRTEELDDLAHLGGPQPPPAHCRDGIYPRRAAWSLRSIRPAEVSLHVLMRRHLPSAITGPTTNVREYLLSCINQRLSIYVPLRAARQCVSAGSVATLFIYGARSLESEPRSEGDPGRTRSLNLFCRSGTFNGRILEVPCIR